MASSTSAPDIIKRANADYLFRILTEPFTVKDIINELEAEKEENKTKSPGTLSKIITIQHKMYVLANYDSTNKEQVIKQDLDTIELIKFVFDNQFSQYVEEIKELAERIKTNAVIFNNAAKGTGWSWINPVSSIISKNPVSSIISKGEKAERTRAAAEKAAADKARLAARAEAARAEEARAEAEKKALNQAIATAKNIRDKTIEYKNTLRLFYINQLEIKPDPDEKSFEKGGSLSKVLYIDITANSLDYKVISLTGKSDNVTKSGKQGKILINKFVDELNAEYERNKLSKYTAKVELGLKEIKRVLDSGNPEDKGIAQSVITKFLKDSRETDSTLINKDAFSNKIQQITTTNNQLKQDFEKFKTEFKKRPDKGESAVKDYDALLARADDIITNQIQKLYNSLRVIDNTKFKSVNGLFDQIKDLNDKVEKTYKELLKYELSSLTAIRKQLEDAAKAKAEIAREAAEAVAREAEAAAAAAAEGEAPPPGEVDEVAPPPGKVDEVAVEEAAVEEAAAPVALPVALPTELAATHTAIDEARRAINEISLEITDTYDVVNKSKDDLDADLDKLNSVISLVKTANKRQDDEKTKTNNTDKESELAEVKKILETNIIDTLVSNTTKISEAYQAKVTELNAAVTAFYSNKKDMTNKKTVDDASDEASKLKEKFEIISNFLTENNSELTSAQIFIRDAQNALYTTANKIHEGLLQEIQLLMDSNEIEELLENINLDNTKTDGFFNSEVKNDITTLREKVTGDKWAFFTHSEVTRDDLDYKKVKAKIGNLLRYSKKLKDAREKLTAFVSNYNRLYPTKPAPGEQNNYSTFITKNSDKLQLLENEFKQYKIKLKEISERIDNKQQTNKSDDGSITSRATQLNDYSSITDINDPSIEIESTNFTGGTRRGGKRFHKKTIKKNLVHKKTFKKKRFNRNTGNKKTFKKKTSNTKTGNNKTGNNKRFNNKTGNNKIVNKKTIRKNYFKRKQTHKK